MISLVVQALGGAVASHAVGQGNNPAKVSIPPHYDAQQPPPHIATAGRKYHACWYSVPDGYVERREPSYVAEALTATDSASITFYMILASEFVLRYLFERPLRPSEKRTTGYTLDRKTELMLVGLAFSSLCIYIRFVFHRVPHTFRLLITGPIVFSQVGLPDDRAR